MKRTTNDRTFVGRIAVVGLMAFAIAALAIGPLAAEATCDPLPSGVTAWWPGEATADDLTLAAHDGLLIGGTAFSPGVSGQPFEFDGTDDRVDVPDSPDLRPERFTLSAWIRADDDAEWACLICKQYSGTNYNSLSLWINDGVLQGGMYGFREAIAPEPLPVGQVLHTAVTYDGSVIRL